jgi:hypothetical protein
MFRYPTLHPKGEMMRKAMRIVSLLSVLALFGCLDIYEHVSKEANGNINVYLKLTVAKSLLSIANSGSDTANANPFDSITGPNGSEITKEITDVFKGTLTKVDTELETGMAMQLSLNMKSKDVQSYLQSDDVPLLPKIDDEKIVFSFSNPSSSSTEDNQMGMALLSSYKFRLTISKSVCPRVSKVVLATDEFDYKPQIISLPDMFLIEIPLSYLMKSSQKTELIVYK